MQAIDPKTESLSKETALQTVARQVDDAAKAESSAAESKSQAAKPEPQLDDRLASLAAHVSHLPKAAHLDFSVDPQTGTTTVQVVDSESGDILREMPIAQLTSESRELAGTLGSLLDRPA